MTYPYRSQIARSERPEGGISARRCRSSLGALATLVLWAALVSPATGYSPPELSWANCSGNVAAKTTVLEVRALPQEGSKVTAGDPVTFSAPAGVLNEGPLTFAVASSPSLLASPNIDQGPGQPSQPSQPEHMLTFTSLKAAATAGTVYWDVSFEADELPECAGVAWGLISTPPRTLVVEPAPAPAPQIRSLTPPPTPPPAIFGASISPSSTNPHHATVAFGVHCTESCVGTVDYLAIAVRNHRSIQIQSLNFRPHRVSISGSGGGTESFSHRYAGVALRQLRRLIEAHDSLAFRISASITSRSGETMVAHATAQMRY